MRGGGDHRAVDDRGDVRDGVADVDAHAGGFADAVESGDGLVDDVESRDVEGLEHHLGESVAIGAAGEDGLRDERGALVAFDPSELAVEDVRVHALELVPVHHAALVDRAKGRAVVADATHEVGGDQGLAIGDGVSRLDEVVVVVDDNHVVAYRGRHGVLGMSARAPNAKKVETRGARAAMATRAVRDSRLLLFRWQFGVASLVRAVPTICP